MKPSPASAFLIALCVAGTWCVHGQGTALTVTTAADSGPGSLRQAVLQANASLTNSTIGFNVTGTITLASTLPPITGTLTFLGSGTNALTVSGGNSVQVLIVSTGATVTISGLTIANGLATGYANGAGVCNLGTLSILNSALVNNTNLGGWGGAVFNSGDLTASNSAFIANQVTGENGYPSGGTGEGGAGGGGAGMGGGIFSLSGVVDVTACSFVGNTATGGNGGIASYPGTGTARGGGVNGGQGGSRSKGFPGGLGGGGGGGDSSPAYGVYYAGGQGGLGGGGGGGDVTADGGIGGFAAGTGAGGREVYFTGGGGGGGAGLGGSIYADSGTVSLANCSFWRTQTGGGLGGAGSYGGAWGAGVVGGIFTRSATVTVSNSAVSVVNATMPMETWYYLGATQIAPVGTPLVLADGQVVLSGEVVKRGAVQVSLRTSFTNGTVFYSLDGSDPLSNPTLYTGSVVVAASAILRAVAFNPSFSASAGMDPVQITIYPTLTVNTAQGGTVAVEPPAGAYYPNNVAQITAQPGPGCTFLQWLGDASGTNPVTTIAMNGNKLVQPVFGTTVGIQVVGAGSVTAGPSVPVYPFGATIKFTALPEAGNYLAFWGGLGANNPLNLVVSATNPTVTAVFLGLGANQSALTVIEKGGGHVETHANYYPNGTAVTLTAVPDAGQSFIGWSGSAVGSQPLLTLTVNSNEVVTANFSEWPRLEVGTPLEEMAEGGFRVTLIGEYSASYEVFSSTDLVNWTLADLLTNPYGTCQFTDLAATNFSRRFYRALKQP